MLSKMFFLWYRFTAAFYIYVKSLAGLTSACFNQDKVQIFYYPKVTLNPYADLLYSHFPPGFAACFAPPSTALWLKRLRPAKTVIFHMHWLFPVLKYPQRLRAMLERLQDAGVIIVWTVHNLQEHDAPDLSADRMIRNDLSSLADIIHLHAPVQDAVVGFLDAKKCVIAPHGNYIETYGNTLSTLDSRALLGIDNDETVFLFIGLIRPYKGLDTLLDAFCQIKKEGLRMTLLVVGEVLEWTQGEALLSSMSEAGVRIVKKYIKDNDMQIYMNAADFCIFPYNKVLTSGSAILALSFAKPIIVPCIGMFPYIISEGREGFLYDSQNADGLVAVLRKAVSIPKETQRLMSEAALEKARSFAWKDTAETLAQSIMRQAPTASQRAVKGFAVVIDEPPSEINIDRRTGIF